jgi:hypothetical protein
MKKPSRKSLVLFGLFLVAVLAVSYMWKSGKAMRDKSSQRPSGSPSPFPVTGYPEKTTLEIPQTCTSRTLQQFQLADAPSTVPPEGVYWGCHQGYEENERGPLGALSCKNKYNGKVAPPQKFKHTGKKWYGCSFNAEHDLWACPSCTV